MRLKDKVCIITGGGQGLGKEYSLHFAREGAKVVVAEINWEKAQQTAQEITKAGGDAFAVRTDVSDEASTQKMAKETVDRYGRIDVLVNNAAIYYGIGWRAAEDLKVEEWDRMLRVNVIGTWLCCKAVFPYMKKQGKGKIVNISSGVVWAGVPRLLHYTASKGAVVSMTRALAVEWSKYNILVNSAAPGYTMTEASLKLAEEEPESKPLVLAKQCIKRLAEPRDIVGAVLFLASADSDFITGQNISVDGGQVLR
ncbi:MAG: SDR family NAD(P)-dependent oxidoreductase [Candidatus Bathyarchaeia archaeon]